MPEAPLQESGSGLAPTGPGWFVVNVGEAYWLTTEGGEKQTTGSECNFETPYAAFPEFAFRIHVLSPGESNGLYHEENTQECFLVLSGEATLLVEDEERRLKQWDMVHTPAGCRHIFLGAGDGPCAILMVGTRPKDWSVVYPVSELALKHNAGAPTETADPDEAYANFEPGRRERPSFWSQLPWA